MNMRKIYFIILFTLGISLNTFAQKGFPNYYKYWDLYTKADSLSKSQNYLAAAPLFMEASQIEVERGIEFSTDHLYYFAALAYTQGKKWNNAFETLYLLVHQNKFTNIESLTSEVRFDPLKKDKRWTALLDAVKTNMEEKKLRDKIYLQRTQHQGHTGETIFYPYTDHARKFLDNDSFPFISIHHEQFKIFFSAHSHAAKNLDYIKKELSLTMSRSLSILDSTSYDRGIYVVVLDSPEDMQHMTGFYVHGGLAVAGHDLLFVIFGEHRRPQFVHEGFHLISFQLWGLSHSQLLIEGSAVYADNQCYYDNPVHSIASYIIKNEKSFPLQSLIDNFDDIAHENDVIAYFLSASIFKYLYEKYGVSKMKKLWTAGFNSIEDIYQFSVQDLEKEWLTYLENVPVPADMNWEHLSQKGCE